MSKSKVMDEEKLLSILQAQEQDSAAFTWGTLASERESSMKEYFRMPYGTESDGWSSIVTSDVQDTIEWILPALLKIFTSTDKAVSFDPVRAEDVEGAEQATDACNYVFYKQNDGFLTLYTAFKDALTVKNCAVMWRKETKRVKKVTPVKGASAEMLAMVMQEAGEDAEIESATPQQPQPMMGPQGPMVDPMTGQPMMGPQLFDARIRSYEEKTSVKIEAFPPEELLIKRDWTSPMLDDCPYVARIPRVTLSDLHEMGFTDVVAEDLADSDDSKLGADKAFRENRMGTADAITGLSTDSDDESQTEGFLRIEYVLVDFDGDGIAERRCIYRLKDKILKNEEADDVPFATSSPILNTHRWDGMSVAETVSDLQKLRTELTRQMVNSAVLANNPRTKVLTDAQGAPLANIDDLLTSAPGRILRQRQPDAIQEHVTPWVGGQMFPMLEYIDHMREQRTGVSRASQGIDGNALRHDRTAAEVMQTANAAAARIELIARIFAETLVKPIFKGIFKLLCDGEMEPLAFRLRDEFVQYDPNEWRNGYDMTINVGLGTGDKQQQAALLQAIFTQQGAIAASPVGKLLIQPKNIYATVSKIVENAGFKNVGDFYVDPGEEKTPEAGPPPEVMLEQMKLQADAQKFQAQTQHEKELESVKAEAKLMETRGTLELQAANDARDGEREAMKAERDAMIEQQRIELDRWRATLEAETQIYLAQMAQGQAAKPSIEEGEDLPSALATAINGMTAVVGQMGKARRIVRGPDGRAEGIE